MRCYKTMSCTSTCTHKNASYFPMVFSCLVGYLPALGRDEVARSRRIGQQLWQAPLQDMRGENAGTTKDDNSWVIKSPGFFWGPKGFVESSMILCGVLFCSFVLFLLLEPKHHISIFLTLQDILGDPMCQTLFLWCINVSTNKIETLEDAIQIVLFDESVCQQKPKL